MFIVQATGSVILFNSNQLIKIHPIQHTFYDIDLVCLPFVHDLDAGIDETVSAGPPYSGRAMHDTWLRSMLQSL